MFYILVFLVIGVVLGYFFDIKIAAVLIVTISVIWFFAYGHWAFATFIELLIGCGVGLKAKEK